jgi:multicomponent Na+:H+ antiporter subunit E
VTASTSFLLNVLLALTWSAVMGEFTLGTFTVGFVLGYLILALAQPVVGGSGYSRKAGRIIALLLFFVWELVVASVRVAHDVVTPTHRARPGVLAIPLDATSDGEITVLANLISLTPGTLSLEVSEDRRVLYIHAMFIEDPDAIRREIKEGFERRVLGIFR